MNTSAELKAATLSNLHLVCGSGGTRAFLTCAGLILACDSAEIKTWGTIGGVSGGSIISALYAGGVPAPQLVEQVVGFDFSSLFKKNSTKSIGRHAFRRGLMSSRGLGEVIDKQVADWPENFWTMAVSGNNCYLFTANGVCQIRNGRSVRIAANPPPLGLAIRASCAVPGILESIEYSGRYLFDGALSDYGDCPTRVVRDHFSVPSDKIIACDVSGVMTRRRRAVFALARLISGRISQKLYNNSHAGEIFIAPKVEHLGGSLQFVLTREQKEAAVLSGFSAGVRELANSRLLTGDKLALCQEAATSYRNMHRILIA